MATSKVFGEVDPRFQIVKDVFVQNFERYGEIGASFCVYFNGQKVVDLYGGWANQQANEPWQRDTLTNVYSCTKFVTNVCITHLVSKGFITFDTKISQIWPDFGNNGKENITIEQLITHQAGLIHLSSKRVTNEEMVTWTEYLNGKRPAPALYDTLVSQPSMFNKEHYGKVIAYSPLVIGFYVSEIVRRSDPQNRRFSILHSFYTTKEIFK